MVTPRPRARHPTEPLPDLGAGARGGDVALVGIEPVAAGTTLALCSEDLHNIAVLQLVIERDQPAADLGADAAVAQFRVDAVGEVDRRRGGRGTGEGRGG